MLAFVGEIDNWFYFFGTLYNLCAKELSFKKTDNPLHLGAKGKSFSNAKILRKTSTEAEKALWSHLRGSNLNGYKFRRQHPISGFIADFYCHEAKLVVEIDGGIHDLPQYKEHDDGRTYELENIGIRVIRFTNREVIENIENVLNQIVINLTLPAEPTSPPGPLS